MITTRRYTVPAWASLGLSIVIWASILHSSLAHTCDVQQLHLTVGEACLWKITADRTETTTTYTPTLTGSSGIAGISPNVQFKAHHGDFVIRGLAPGTNQLTVVWFYPGTPPAGGVCTVTIVVTAPAPGQTSFQTIQGHGQLSTAEFGKVIEARTLRGLLDFYVPASALKLIILTECFGGNIAQSPFFLNLPNTAIASGTSANQEGRTGGYPDDAARTLKPEQGKTGANVHHAGTVGRQTVEQVDNPQNDKETSFIMSEWPTVAGGLSLASFPLDPVSSNGPIESRHVVVYCGKPISKDISVETHDGATIPSIDGQKAPFSDAKDRDTIKQNFAGEPNTTVTTAGGEPQAGDRRLGQDGWDYSGTLGGLEAAIKKAGDAIRNSPHPEREQFILFVGDHGMMGTLGNSPAPSRPSTPNSRSELAPAFQTFASDGPAVHFMEQDPNNLPGFLLSLEFGQNLVAFPTFQPGAFALELNSMEGGPIVLRDFIADPVDIDGNSMLGSREGEGVNVFFPVNEYVFLSQFVDRQTQISLVNNSQESFSVSKVEQVTGSIEPGWTPVRRPKILGPIMTAQNSFEFMLSGTPGRSYLIEGSADMQNWRTMMTLTLESSIKAFRDPPNGRSMFYRAHLVE